MKKPLKSRKNRYSTVGQNPLIQRFCPLGIALFFLFSLNSCLTIVKTVDVETVNNSDIAQLEQLEINLIKCRISEDPSLLKTCEKIIKSLEKKETVNKRFKAKLIALKTEAYILKSIEKGNRDSPSFLKKTEASLKEIELYNPGEERVFILKALLSSTPYSKKDYLIRGSKRSDASRSFLELGLLSFENGDYKEAVAYFDQATMKLPESYGELFEKKRDQAFRLSKNENGGTGAAKAGQIYIKEKITLNEALSLLKSETGMLKGVSESNNIEDISAFLKKNGYISDKKIAGDDFLPRRELANILAWLMAKKENNLNLPAESGDYYRDNKLGSPIADVPVKDKFFNVVVVVLEEEIMDLPDGENFFPKRAVSGSDLEKSLKNLKRSYR